MAEIIKPDDLEVAPGFTYEHLQGWVPQLESEEEIRTALEKAFDYRGDIRITRKSGAVIDGNLYDRRTGDSLSSSVVRLLPADGSPRVSISYSDVAALQFSDRDPAAGKSWEAWVKKYQAKKAAGQTAAIEAEPLE